MAFLSVSVGLFWIVMSIVLFIKYYKALKRIENLIDKMERELDNGWLEKV